MNREQIAQDYSDGENGLEPLSWGRIKVLVRLAPAIVDEFPNLVTEAEEVEPEILKAAPELGDLVISTYLMPFSNFRSLAPTTYKETCERFADDVDLDMVGHCIDAIARDWKAIEASLVKAFDSGKQAAPAAGLNHSGVPC